MMSRCFALLMLLCCQLAQGASPTVLHRLIELDLGGGQQLHGTLLLPQASHKVPVVLMLSGSGPTDRDGNNPEGGRNDSLKRLAERLAQQGIASVRYDKRGVASGLPVAPDERTLSVEAYVDDAVAWASKLAGDPRLGPLVILGHSEGALIATLAAGPAGARGVVSLSGSGRPVDQVLRSQLRERLPAELRPRGEQIIDRLKAGQFEPDVPAALQVVFRPSVQPYLISLFRQDPAKAFAQVQVPALIVQGRNDIQVGEADARALAAANPNAQLVLINGMNHVLRIVAPDTQAQLASYRDPKLPLAGELGQRVAAFVQEVTAPQ